MTPGAPGWAAELAVSSTDRRPSGAYRELSLLIATSEADRDLLSRTGDLKGEVVGLGDRRPAVVDAELGVDALGVRANGVERDREFPGDVRPAKVASQQP